MLTSNVTKERADKMKMGRVYVVNKMFAGYEEEPNPLDALNKLEALNEALKDENKVCRKIVNACKF